MSSLNDVSAERAVLAGLFKYGSDVYYDVADILTSKTFTLDSNKIIWMCLQHIFESNTSVVDYPVIISSSKSIGYADFFNKEDERSHLRAITNFPVKQESVRSLAAKIRKLEIARLATEQLEEARNNLSTVTGDETVDDILNKLESPIFDFTSCLTENGMTGPRKMGEGVVEYLQHLANNPRSMIGISTGFKRLDKALGGGLRDNSLDVIVARMKQGKAQPLDAKIQTPTGPKRMGDIIIGDRVCTPTGTSTVIAIHPQGVVPIYRVAFADGDFTECCENHLWEVTRWAGKPRLMTLKEIMSTSLSSGKSGNRKFSVRCPVECEMDLKEVPLHPYLLGLMLGDGSFRSNTPSFTNDDQDLIKYLRSLLIPEYHLKKTASKYSYLIGKKKRGMAKNVYKDQFERMSLWGLTSHHKFIPDIYKYNSREIRLLILRGLMDTDGDSDESGNVTISTTSIRMANDVKFIVQSLGGLCHIAKRYTKCNGKRFLSYRCGIKTNNNGEFFALKRKWGRCQKRKKNNIKRTIKSIKLIGRKEAQCITIADPRGLYLTDHCIVTHNSFLVDNVALHIAGKLNIPVYSIDTEMSWEEHVHRVAACMSGATIEDIETGRFAKSDVSRNMVIEAAARLKDMPIHYESVIGKPFEEVLAGMRRWINKTVGIQINGKAKPCAIIYDYLKMMSADFLSDKLQEYQALGFITTALKNFVGRYSTRCLTFAQANREGISGEDTDIVGDSDRIARYATSIILYKKKTTEERAEAQPYGGSKYTHKLVPLVCRSGEGLDKENYINVLADYAHGRVIEGPTQQELIAGGNSVMAVNNVQQQVRY
jgi:replicative DNA helicase